MSQTMLYRHPGEHEIHGDKFDYIIVDDDDIEEYLEAGWSETTADALENSGAEIKNVEPASHDDDEQSSDDEDDDDDGDSDVDNDELLKAAAEKIDELTAQAAKDAEASKELTGKLEASEARVAELEKAAAEPKVPEPDPENRAFMELVAEYLDIPFKPSIGDAKLRDRVIEAIKGDDASEKTEGEGQDGVE